MKRTKPILSICIFLCMMSAHLALAQKSYIYIELIKSIPCRVMQNGTEVPQLNKNYVLLNVNDQREQNIDIEFGAGLYPNQSFVIDAVPDAAYGYKLAKSGEKSFYLLDLINNGKIIESNSKVNIGLPTSLNTIHFGKNQKPNLKRTTVKKGNWINRLLNSLATNKQKNTPQAPVVKQQLKKEVPTKSNTPYGVVQVIRSDDQVKLVNNESIRVKASESSSAGSTKPQTQPMRAGCNSIASDKEVEHFAEKIAMKSDEETQLLMARKKQFTGCLTAKQMVKIGENYRTQFGRFQFVKIMQSKVANPMELPQCESLFKTEAYKNKFLELINAD